jgi:Arc/MetJ family transcription regulator
MRTNIVLNDDLLREAMKYTRARTKRALVEEALRVLIETRSGERRVRDYRERAEALDRKLERLVLREPPHRILRSDRSRS